MKPYGGSSRMSFYSHMFHAASNRVCPHCITHKGPFKHLVLTESFRMSSASSPLHCCLYQHLAVWEIWMFLWTCWHSLNAVYLGLWCQAEHHHEETHKLKRSLLQEVVKTWLNCNVNKSIKGKALWDFKQVLMSKKALLGIVNFTLSHQSTTSNIVHTHKHSHYLDGCDMRY